MQYAHFTSGDFYDLLRPSFDFPVPSSSYSKKKKGKEKKKVLYYDRLSFSIFFMCLGIAGFFFLFVTIVSLAIALNETADLEVSY